MEYLWKEEWNRTGEDPAGRAMRAAAVNWAAFTKTEETQMERELATEEDRAFDRWLTGIRGTDKDEDGKKSAFVPWTRYCPECAKDGFFSRVHRLAELTRCPLHGSRLRDLKEVPAPWMPVGQEPYHHGREDLSGRLGVGSIAEIVTQGRTAGFAEAAMEVLGGSGRTGWFTERNTFKREVFIPRGEPYLTIAAGTAERTWSAKMEEIVASWVAARTEADPTADPEVMAGWAREASGWLMDEEIRFWACARFFGRTSALEVERLGMEARMKPEAFSKRKDEAADRIRFADVCMRQSAAFSFLRTDCLGRTTAWSASYGRESVRTLCRDYLWDFAGGPKADPEEVAKARLVSAFIMEAFIQTNWERYAARRRKAGFKPEFPLVTVNEAGDGTVRVWTRFGTVAGGSVARRVGAQAQRKDDGK